MDLRHLRYFIAVAEELNFSRAAARLHVSQPPLSRQIRGLEAELKVKLLDRNTQGVRLTRAGHAVLVRSRKLVCDAESLRAEAQTIGKESAEELRIGYAPSPTAVIISGVLARYHELSPGAGVSLHDLTHTEMLSGLRAGKLHVALTIRPAVGEMRGLKFETIRCHPVGIICSNSSPLARQPAVRPSLVAMSELVVYRAREFPEYHQWVSKILRVSQGRLRTEAIGGDFFKSVPEGDLYLLRFILHDWDDANAIRILENCRRAMKPDARLVVIEAFFAELGEQIPANMIDTQVPLFDLHLMVAVNGRERSVAEYGVLFDKVGFRTIKTTPLDNGYVMIETAAA